MFGGLVEACTRNAFHSIEIVQGAWLWREGRT